MTDPDLFPELTGNLPEPARFPLQGQLFCERCQRIEQFDLPLDQSFEWEALARGWRLTEDGAGWVCPECRFKEKEC